jgi:hypothetical protein
MRNLFDHRLGMFRFFMPITTQFWPIVLAALSAVSTAASINQGNKAAEDAQAAAVARQNLMNQQQAQEMEEVQAEAGLEATNEARESLRQQASIRAAAAESGVAGASPLRELANVYMQEAIDVGTIISKEEAQLRTIGMQSQQTHLETQSSINQAESAKSTGLNAALQIGVSGAQGYMLGGGGAATSTATASSAGTGSFAGYGQYIK